MTDKKKIEELEKELAVCDRMIAKGKNVDFYKRSYYDTVQEIKALTESSDNTSLTDKEIEDIVSRMC